ncbi:hypothetical protein O0I10_001800 [Lichtheimia ornata]|uniref:Uncharacterized protein n=1 Tax=Lichtheimia ornata TaxID=688661 RepID=A0AAD7V9X6_9FUNG|nr:uncharacterized protein O0I10_001800 [Lichtheimia ornata]KAJ8662109.1 hypothetical protein O0I10_001800 [Lichtheimia ornata]
MDHREQAQDGRGENSTAPQQPVTTEDTALHVIMQSLQVLLQQHNSSSSGTRSTDELDGIRLVPPEYYSEDVKVRFASTLLEEKLLNGGDNYKMTLMYMNQPLGMTSVSRFAMNSNPNNSEQLAREAFGSHFANKRKEAFVRHPISILIDSGASANYMSPRFVTLADKIVPIATPSSHHVGSWWLHCYGPFRYTCLIQIRYHLGANLVTGSVSSTSLANGTLDFIYQEGDKQYVLEPIRDHPPEQAPSSLYPLISAKELKKCTRHEEEDEDHAKTIIKAYPKVFDEKGLQGLPPDRGVPHVIDTGSTPPINRPPYRMSPRELDELKKRQLNELLKLGLIEPSTSPWGAPILFVRKMDQ